MIFARTAVAMAVGLALALAPGAGRASKPIPPKPPVPEVGTTGADKVCQDWILKYLRTGSKDMLLDDAKVRLLWREPETKPEKFLKKTLGKFKSAVYWDSVESKAGKEILECRVLMGMDREFGKGGWIHGVDLYARYDLVKEEGGLKGSRVSIVLEYDQNDKTGSIFERPLDMCNISMDCSGFVPDRLCAIMTIHDTPKGNPHSEIWIVRDMAEAIVFTKSGHLASYTLLGMSKGTDDGNAPPLGYTEVEDVELGLGKKVVAVRQEKITPMGKGKGECAAYMIEGSLSYHMLKGNDIVEIFSKVVDVFPDAPCASDKQLDKMKDMIVNVDPICKGNGPCDLQLTFDYAAPKEKHWTEIWKFDGKTYKKVK